MVIVSITSSRSRRAGGTGTTLRRGHWLRRRQVPVPARPWQDLVRLQGVQHVLQKEVELAAPREPTGGKAAVAGHEQHRPGVQVEQLSDLGSGKDGRVLLPDPRQASVFVTLHAPQSTAKSARLPTAAAPGSLATVPLGFSPAPTIGRVNDFSPLGSYEEFTRWTGQARSWRAGGMTQVNFGGDVLAGLTDGIAGHVLAVGRQFPAKAEAIPVALGCVPWLDSAEVVDALITVGHQLVVVSKGIRQRSATDRLKDEGSGVNQSWLPGLADYGPLDEDGIPPVIDPASGIPGNRLLEAVRVVGWKKGGKHAPPLLHAKLCILGAHYIWEGDHGEFNEHFRPMRVWLGSANWTTGSAGHLEFGLWSDDPQLAAVTLEFFCDLVRFSEPYSAATVGPEPELVAATWDDEAFADYAAEYGRGLWDDAEDDVP
jgi:hypothetical protein